MHEQPSQPPTVNDTIVGMRRAVDGPPATLTAQPIPQHVLRMAARQAGVADDQPIPAHIQNAAQAIADAYASMASPASPNEVAARFLVESLSITRASDVRLAIRALDTVLDAIHGGLSMMHEEVSGRGQTFEDVTLEAIWRAYQTHVVGSLDLLNEARARLERGYESYRAAEAATLHQA